MPNQIYLFFGDEDYLISEKLAELKKGIMNPSLNIEQINGDEKQLEQIIAALSTQPFFAGEKLIIIKNIDLKSKIWEKLIESLKVIHPGLKVVFWASSIHRATKIYKLIDSLGEVYEFKTYTDWQQDELIAWIARRVKSQGKDIDRPTAARLQEICGNSMRKLASEIDKLITYIGERKRIKQEDVLALASHGVAGTFALTDALSEKKLARALAVLDSLFKNKAPIFPLLALLASQYKTMLLAKSLSKNGSNNANSIAKTFESEWQCCSSCASQSLSC